MQLSQTHIGQRGTISLPIIGVAYAGTTGFQSPADDYLEDRIDLARELVTTKANHFCWRVSGDSFRTAGVLDGSIVVIDYSMTPKVNDIVLVKLGDIVTLKRIRAINGRLHLTSATPGYPVIPIDSDEGVQVFGVLKHCVLSF